MSTSLSAAPLLLLVSLPLAASCASSSNGKKSEDPKWEVQSWNPAVLTDRDKTGVYLAELDNSLTAWNNLLLTAKSREDLRKIKLLEEDIAYRATKRLGPILEQLESGPPRNRQVAALALGFTGSEAVLSPLLAATSDPIRDVASNAIMGLAVLQSPATPLVDLENVMESSPHGRTRSNASWAILRILQAGGEGDDGVLDAARQGLRDEEPSVRAHSALILAHLADNASLDTLKLQLYDDVNVSACAASRALAYLAARDETIIGSCARAMTSSLDEVNATVRGAILRDLMRLSRKNWGKDTEAWVDWANRLP